MELSTGSRSNAIKKLYDLNVEDISYVTVVFYLREPVDNSIHLVPKAWIALLQFSAMVGSSMFCVAYFGYKCYSEISSQLTMSSVQSKSTNVLQNQLYFAMVGQTVIPVFFMYIPVVIFVFGPVFMIEIGVMSTFITHAVTLYPVLDPLPNMVIIKSYRNAITDIWKRIKKRLICKSNKPRVHVEAITSVGTTLRHINGGSTIF